VTWHSVNDAPVTLEVVGIIDFSVFRVVVHASDPIPKQWSVHFYRVQLVTRVAREHSKLLLGAGATRPPKAVWTLSLTPPLLSN